MTTQSASDLIPMFELFADAAFPSKSRRAKRVRLGTVYAVETAGMCGYLDRVTGKIMVPDRDRVREHLPHYWRAAFDRSGNGFWYVSDAACEAFDKGTLAAMTLYDTRHEPIAYVYARPYRYDLRRAARIAGRIA